MTAPESSSSGSASDPIAPVPFAPADAWDELVHKDDRTSPEEYPDHCLISFGELQDYMTRGIKSEPLYAAPQPVGNAYAPPEIWLLAGRLAGAELNYRNTYERLGGGHIETGRAWDKLRTAGDAIRDISDPVWDVALSSTEGKKP